MKKKRSVRKIIKDIYFLTGNNDLVNNDIADTLQELKQVVMEALPKKLDVLEFEEDEEQTIILVKGHNLAIDKAITNIEKLFE